jgi:hypothetical protein
MLDDGARHRAPMPGSLGTEQCKRSDVNVLISGDCGQADAIHGGRRRRSRRTYARNKDDCTRCCCKDECESDGDLCRGLAATSVDRESRHPQPLGSPFLRAACYRHHPVTGLIHLFHTPSCLLALSLGSTTSLRHVQTRQARF